MPMLHRCRRAIATDARMKPTFTIGIEEEYQTVDPVTRDLRSHIHAEIIEKGKLRLQERVKAEMHQSVVEVGTSVCNNIKEAKDEVKKLRRDMITLARENGLRLASAATHPFADWRVQEIYPGRALPQDRRRHAAGGARQSDFRPARPHRRGGPRDRHPHDESRTLLSCRTFSLYRPTRRSGWE